MTSRKEFLAMPMSQKFGGGSQQNKSQNPTVPNSKVMISSVLSIG